MESKEGPTKTTDKKPENGSDKKACDSGKCDGKDKLGSECAQKKGGCSQGK